MEKLIALVLAIILATAATAITESTETKVPVVTVDEEVKPIFEKDLSVCKEDSLSVYRRDIREKIKGEWVDCDCRDLCSCTSLFHVLEDTTEDDFYSAFLNYIDNGRRTLGAVYVDCSSSMEETFCYEKSKIIKNLSTFLNEKERNIETIFKNQKTGLYGFLHSLDRQISGDLIITAPKEIPIIITDLWDTEENEIEPFRYWGEIIFCVPYASTNKEGVLHCEEVVNDILWNYSLMTGSVGIWVVYTDNVIVRYTNGIHNAWNGSIDIYVP